MYPAVLDPDWARQADRPTPPTLLAAGILIAGGYWRSEPEDRGAGVHEDVTRVRSAFADLGGMVIDTWGGIHVSYETDT